MKARNALDTRPWRTAIALLSVAALLVGVVAPAAARGKPNTPPDLVTVTMMGALATTCEDGDGVDDAMVMRRDGDSLFPAYSARLALDISGIVTDRRYPEPVSASGFTGCHGEQLDGSSSPYGGMGISLDESGRVTDLLWHFDYYLEMEARGKREVMSVMEHFTLSGHGLIQEGSTVSGFFNVLYHLEDTVNHVSFGYEPVEGSPVFLTFELTIDG